MDVAAKVWKCPFCFRHNPFPPHYSGITETNLPAELIPSFTTIEYILPRAASLPPVFLFVVDTCMTADELQPLKDTLLMGLSLIPQNALVGLITYGATVRHRPPSLPFSPWRCLRLPIILCSLPLFLSLSLSLSLFPLFVSLPLFLLLML